MSTFTAYEDGEVRIVRVGPMGPWDNNAYLVRDLARKQTLLVDMPLEAGPLLEALRADGGVSHVVATHWHPDHWATYEQVRAAVEGPVCVGDREINIPADRIDRRLADDEELRVGNARVRVIHTPGHTPGSISLRVGGAVISGDTLFAGGPGKTFAVGDLETLLASISARLHPLGDDMLVLPGHGGATTTIGEARQRQAEYAKHPHPPGYYGDVHWGG